jgi:hypothetical protein
MMIEERNVSSLFSFELAAGCRYTGGIFYVRHLE